MTMIGEYLDSPIRCRCGKRMVMDLGQDANTGWVHEHHSCLSCGAEVRERPRADRTATVLTVKQLLARRTAHLDRGRIVEQWVGTMTPAEIEELADAADS
jgi:hypothetical protein